MTWRMPTPYTFASLVMLTSVSGVEEAVRTHLPKYCSSGATMMRVEFWAKGGLSNVFKKDWRGQI